MKSSGNLFNTIGFLLSIDEMLRLATIYHGVEKFEHYIEIVSVHAFLLAIYTFLCHVVQERGGRAQQLVAVLVGDDVFSTRPLDHPTVEELVTFALTQEIMAIRGGTNAGIITRIRML